MPQPGPRDAAFKAGERYYISDVPCPKGHVGKRFTKTYECHECRMAARARQAQSRRGRRGHVLRPQPPNSMCRHTRRYLFLPTYRDRFSPLIGCNGATLRAHIERLWQPGMTWDNYGNGPDHWQIDHKVPLDKFDLDDPVQRAAAGHYTNVQPLWRRQNLQKSYL